MTTIASRRRGNSRSWTTGWPRSVVQGMTTGRWYERSMATRMTVIPNTPMHDTEKDRTRHIAERVYLHLNC